jgi:hypothetical protein
MINTKFKVGDRVRQIHNGYNTAPKDNNKEAIVIAIRGKYIDPNDGIKIKCIGDWYHTSSNWRGQEAFELVERKVPKTFGIVGFCKKYYKELNV